MFFPGKIEKSAEERLKECRSALYELRAQIDLSSLDEEIVVSSQSSLYSKVAREGNLYFIKEGTLKCVRDGKVFYYAEEGDIIGFEGSAFDEAMDFYAEFAVVVSPIDPKLFLTNNESAKAWNRFQGNFLSALLGGLSQDMKADTLFSPEIRSFPEGEIIVSQGSAGDEVFSLIDGTAEIIVDNKKVGEVHQDQLFGAVSVLTNSERIATVRATSDCLTVVLSKDQFISLVSNKPDTLLKLAEDLSKAIVSLNDQVHGLVCIAG